MRFEFTPDPYWSYDIVDVIHTAGEAGFDGVGLLADRATPEAVAALRSCGLMCHEVMGIRMVDDEHAVMTGAERVADAAELVGAPWVHALFGSRSDATLSIARRSASMLKRRGLRLAVEFSPNSAITSLSMALGVLRDLGTDDAGVVVDTWHFHFGDSTWSELETVPLDLIAYVQFADGRPPIGSDLKFETSHRRALPGSGTLDLSRFATTLLDRGWDGVVSTEILSAELRHQTVDEYVRSAWSASAKYWR